MKQKRHLFTAAFLAALGNVSAQDKPNIILFLVDDMGWQETSVPFYEEPTPLNERYHTPNMERLAQMGGEVYAGIRLCHFITLAMQSDERHERSPSSGNQLDAGV